MFALLAHIAFAQPNLIENEILGAIHTTNIEEIQVGQLAKSKGSTPEIRRYGDRLVRDHEMADRLIFDYAQQSLIEIPRPQDSDLSEQIQKLSKSSGPAFDQGFLAMMDEGHHQAIQYLNGSRDQLSDTSNLRRLLGKLIPILKQHQKLASSLEQSTGQPSTSLKERLSHG